MSARVEPLWSSGSVCALICVLHSVHFSRAHLSPCLWFILKLAGDFGKEGEGETSSGLSVTYASLAVAGLTALNPIGSIETVFANSIFVSIVVFILVELAE